MRRWGSVRRTLVVGVLALALAAPAAGARSGAQTSWASAAIAAVTKAGLVPGTPASFRPSDPLTAGELGALMTALGTPPPRSPADPLAPVTITALDAALVDALG